MRNLLKYPVTDEERVRVLTYIYDEIAGEQRCGDIRPHILRDAIQQFREPTDEERAVRDARIERLQNLQEWLQLHCGLYEARQWAIDIAYLLTEGDPSIQAKPASESA